MHEVMKEKKVQDEECLKVNSKLEVIMAENLKLKTIIKQLKSHIERL